MLVPRPLQGTPLSPEIYGTDVCKCTVEKINLILCVLMGVCWCFMKGSGSGCGRG